jgi:AI-2E family transporter
VGRLARSFGCHRGHLRTWRSDRPWHAGILRFVPYIGGIIAAVFPIVLAAAVDPGWTMVIATAGLFLFAEPVAAQVIDPVLSGQHTGLSPVAIVVSTLFWTLLWGPIGLLLATPLTVCLVVLGTHVETLKFIEVLLGDEPALEPEEKFYQRLLAGDDTEAADMAEKELSKQRLSTYYDAIPMRALALAQTDAAHGKLSHDKQLEVRDTIAEVVEDLSDHEDTASADHTEPVVDVAIIPSRSLTAEWNVEHPVLCVASRSPLDEAASAMLAQLLGKHGLAGRVQPFCGRFLRTCRQDRRSRCPTCLFVLFRQRLKPHPCALPYPAAARLMPDARFLAGFWMLLGQDEKAEDWRTAVGAHLVATSLSQALRICVDEAQAHVAPERMTTAVE